MEGIKEDSDSLISCSWWPAEQAGISSAFRDGWCLRPATLKTSLPEAHLAESPEKGNRIIIGQDGKGAPSQGLGWGRGHLCPECLPHYVYMLMTVKCVLGNVLFICRCITAECVYEKETCQIPKKIAESCIPLYIQSRRGGNAVLLVFPNAKQVSLLLCLVVAIFQQNENAGTQDMLPETCLAKHFNSFV